MQHFPSVPDIIEVIMSLLHLCRMGFTGRKVGKLFLNSENSKE